MVPVTLLRGFSAQPPSADTSTTALPTCSPRDQDVTALFSSLFGITERSAWVWRCHGISYGTWIQQARLPLRLGGCGLRDAVRTSHAQRTGRAGRIVYRIFWADSLSLGDRLSRSFPLHGPLIHTMSIMELTRGLPQQSLQQKMPGTRLC